MSKLLEAGAVAFVEAETLGAFQRQHIGAILAAADRYLAAHRASSLVDDEALVAKVAKELARPHDDGDMGIGERAAYADEVRAVLRIIDAHIGRGGR